MTLEIILPSLLHGSVLRNFGAYAPYTDMSTCGLILFALTYGRRRLIEVGVEDGSSTVCLLSGMDYAYRLCPPGTVRETIGPDHPRLLSIDQHPAVAAERVINSLGLSPYWTFRQGKAQDILKTVAFEWDFYFHDAEHDQNSVYNDISVVSKLAAKDAIVLSHDCSPGNDAWIGLQRIAKDFNYEGPFYLERSLAIIRKA